MNEQTLFHLIFGRAKNHPNRDLSTPRILKCSLVEKKAFQNTPETSYSENVQHTQTDTVRNYNFTLRTA